MTVVFFEPVESEMVEVSMSVDLIASCFSVTRRCDDTLLLESEMAQRGSHHSHPQSSPGFLSSLTGGSCSMYIIKVYRCV